ncbi:hypothetical protein ACFQRC_11550 [Enterovirga sp. GCM10030262]|uniref:hypothetical protein n=1 Tax=Enterovirga sp. GCM10030262 TaxID=3273391 RepID=UPI00361F077D
MFERLSKRVEHEARERSEARTTELAERMRASLPGGIDAEAVAGGVALSGRGIARRFALDPALRWLAAGPR